MVVVEVVLMGADEVVVMVVVLMVVVHLVVSYNVAFHTGLGMPVLVVKCGQI